MPAWCAARGIDGRSLRFWAGRLEPVGLRVVEMSVPPSNVRPGQIRIRVSGATIAVDETVSEAALTRVIRAVRGC